MGVFEKNERRWKIIDGGRLNLTSYLKVAVFDSDRKKSI